MNIEEYVKLIEFAWEITQKSPESVREDVFKITYSSLLKQKFPANVDNPKPANAIKHALDSTPSLSTFDQKMKIFAEKCNLTTSQLTDVFYIDEMEIHLLARLKGTEAEKQAIASQCILTAYYLLYDKEWLDASQLKKNVKDSGIEGMDHFARNLRRRKNILIRGKGKGATLEYKISGTGRMESFELIHDYGKGDL